MQHRHVMIIGNVATGKSTLMTLLAEAMSAKAIPVDELYKTNPFFAQAVANRPRWSFTSDIWFLYHRVQMTRKYLTELAQTDLVVDSGVLMSWVYASSRLASGTMTEEEWGLYQDLYAELTGHLTGPDVVIYLTAPVKWLRSRIQERGREFEIKNHSEEYLASLHLSLEKLVVNLKATGQQVVTVEAEKLARPEGLQEFVAQFMSTGK